MDAATMKYLATALALLPMAGVGIGLGMIGANLTQAISRNPSASDKISQAGILLAAFTEAIGLFTFGAAMAILFG
jgi:F-type H+-transporting ATPase subunit c